MQTNTVANRNLIALLHNLLLLYLLYTLCRIVFLVANAGLYNDITLSHVVELLVAGMKFDSSAICYTNSLFILLFLLPYHKKENKRYFKTLHWLFVITNSFLLYTNLFDTVYFPFTGRRSTISLFTEFGNEGTGNIFKILYDQTVANWPLGIVFLIIILTLCFGYFSPQKKPNHINSHRSYYLQSTVILLLVAVMAVGQMRGSYTKAIRPLTINNAKKYAETPAETGAILNTPFSLLKSIRKKQLVTPEYMSDKEAEAIFSPLKVPTTNDNVKPDKPNIVILLMESFSKQHFGYYNNLKGENGTDGDKNSFTPFLDSLITNSLTFKYSYATGRKSIEVMPSVLASIPNYIEPFVLTPAAMNSITGIANELTDNWDYSSAFFHGAVNGSMGFDSFAKATGFEKYYGRSEYYEDNAYGGEADFDGTWAIFDEEFLQYYCDKMSEMQQPFVTSIFTATSHTPFTIPARYKGVFPKGKMPIQETVAYSDNALRRFFEKAECQPWYDNTIFVITADHTSGHFDPFYKTTLGRYSVPIIFFAPCLPWLKGYDSETIVEQTDITPTLLGLIGYDKSYVAFGQDILNTPREKKHALHWVTEDESYEFVKDRYAVRFDGEHITAVYDFREDLLQKNDIKDSMPREVKDSLEWETKATIQQYMKCMNTNRMTAETYVK